MIHKYAKTGIDIEKLGEMIGLKQIVPIKSPVLDNMRRQGVLEGIKKGRKEGRKEGIKKGREEGIIYVLTELANDPDNDYNIEKIAYKLGYSVKEVTNDK